MRVHPPPQLFLSPFPFLWLHCLQDEAVTSGTRQHLRSLFSLPTFLSSHRALQVLLPLHLASLLLPQVRCCARSLVSGLDSSSHCFPALGWFCALRQDALLPAHGLCLLWIHIYPPPSHSDLTWGLSQLRITDLARDQVHVVVATKSPQLKDPASAHLPIIHGGSRNCHHRKGQESERSADPHPHPRQLPHNEEEEEQEDEVMASRGPSLGCPSGRSQSSVSRGFVQDLGWNGVTTSPYPWPLPFSLTPSASRWPGAVCKSYATPYYHQVEFAT